MFAFQVRRKEEEQEGSVVGPIFQSNGVSFVSIMWENDWSFSDERLVDIVAVPQVAQGLDEENVVAFPGAGDDTTH